MGQTYEFTWADCGYEAKVSGGEDWGMMCRTHTIHCKDCRELYDIMTADDPRNPKPIRELSPQQYRCPKSLSHAIKLWRHRGSCPKCGETLQRSETPMVNWD